MENGFKYYPITEISEIPEQVGELPRESFVKKYNELVACLNNEIEALYSLYEAYGVNGFLDAEINLIGEDWDNFRRCHKELFDLHPEHYEEYVSMKEDLILAEHKSELEQIVQIVKRDVLVADAIDPGPYGNVEGGDDGEHINDDHDDFER